MPAHVSPLLGALCDECRADLTEERFEREQCRCGYVNPLLRCTFEPILTREIGARVRGMSRQWSDYFNLLLEVGRWRGDGDVVARQWAFAVLMERRRQAAKKVSNEA